MSIGVQLDVAGALTGSDSDPLPSDPTKTTDDEGVLIVTVPGDLGVFNPGELVGGASADYFVQSAQIDSASAPSQSEIRLVGRSQGGGTVNLEPIDLLAQPTPGYYQDGLVVPAGFKIGLFSDGGAPHLVRLTMWPLKTADQAVDATRGAGGTFNVVVPPPIFGSSFESAADDASTTAPTGTPTVKLNHDTANLPAGVYIVHYSWELGNNTPNGSSEAGILINGTLESQISQSMETTSDRVPHAGFKVINLAGANNLQILFRAMTGGTMASMRRARLALWRVA